MPIPITATRSDHALTIRVGGLTIGRIQEWTPQQNRTITPVYELNSATSGEVVENVPGNIGGLTITVNRLDLFISKMEQAWGPNFNILMLTDQTTPLEIIERWDNPDGSSETWRYSGCWFSSLGRTHSASGDRIVKVNASLMYVRKDRIT
jgi:hypothetical protein